MVYKKAIDICLLTVTCNLVIMGKEAGNFQKVRETQHFTAGFGDDGREARAKECGVASRTWEHSSADS